MDTTTAEGAAALLDGWRKDPYISLRDVAELTVSEPPGYGGTVLRDWLTIAGDTVATAPPLALRELVDSASVHCEGCGKQLPPWVDYERGPITNDPFCDFDCYTGADRDEGLRDMAEQRRCDADRDER